MIRYSDKNVDTWVRCTPLVISEEALQNRPTKFAVVMRTSFSDEIENIEQVPDGLGGIYHMATHVMKEKHVTVLEGNSTQQRILCC